MSFAEPFSQRLTQDQNNEIEMKQRGRSTIGIEIDLKLIRKVQKPRFALLSLCLKETARPANEEIFISVIWNRAAELPVTQHLRKMAKG